MLKITIISWFYLINYMGFYLMKNSEINPIKSDSLEINCQKIYDAIIACQREFEGNLIFEKNISNNLNEIEILLYEVNDVELFSEMVDLIFRCRYRARELKSQMKFIEDERILNSKNLNYILEEMNKFKEII